MPRCQRLISRQSRLLPHILLHQEHYPLISCWNSDDLAASLYLYFKTADSVQHQQYCKIKKQPILLCREIWPYVFFLTLWKIVSCASPDDTVLEVQTTHCKQLLQLCSTPALTLCTLTSFSINKTLPLSQNSQHRRGAGFPCFDSRLPATSGFGPADQEQRALWFPPCAPWKGSSSVSPGEQQFVLHSPGRLWWVTVTAVVLPDPKSSSPLSLPVFAVEVVLAVTATGCFLRNWRWWKSLLIASLRPLQLQLSESKKSGLCWVFWSPLPAREASPVYPTTKRCLRDIGGMAHLSQREPYTHTGLFSSRLSEITDMNPTQSGNTAY